MIVHCAECQAAIPAGGQDCPRCGSADILVGVELASGTRVSFLRDSPRVRGQVRSHGGGTYSGSVTVRDGISPTDAMRGQLPHCPPGPVRPHVRVYNDILWNHDRQRMERRLMHTDSERGFYVQEWYALETGELAWRKEGRLSDPDLHGQSARRRREAS
jgi:hypothetical protein